MPPRADWLNLPNKITLARLVIAVLLFVLFSLQIHWKVGDRSVVLYWAAVVFAICVMTDWVDGYLARRWQMVTTFGRIADPFVDKVVVCGSFIYLIKLAPGIVPPWVAVVIVAREFLVTSLRSYIEAQGIPFGSRNAGKLKMVFQSLAIFAILLYEAYLVNGDPESTLVKVGYWTSVTLVVLTLLTTLISAWDYISVSLSTVPRKKSS